MFLRKETSDLYQMIISTSTVIKKLLVVFLVFAGLYFAKGFLIPLAIAGVMATLLLPLCRALEKKRIPKGIAIFTCVVIILAVVGAIGLLLIWQVSSFTSDITLVKQKIILAIIRLQENIFNFSGVSLEKQSQLLQNGQPSVTGVVQMAAGSLINIISGFMFVLAYVFFLLYYRGHIKSFLIRITPVSQRNEMEQVIDKASHVSQQYLVGLIKMIILLWIMYGIGFSLLGIKNALLFAFICGLLEIIPYIGNITGTILTVLITTLHGASLPVLGGIVCVYGGVQFIQGWILEPMIVGPQVKINSLFTIIALVLGGMIWGIAGIFLAIPLMAIFRIISDHIEPLKPYGFLVGETEEENKA